MSSEVFVKVINNSKIFCFSLNVRIVLLVRDPRGTMQSRESRLWCKTPDCKDPSNLCADLVSDYYAAKELKERFPGRVKIVRYEDFSVNPKEGTRNIFSFYGLPFEKTVEQFLDTHTQNHQGGPYSTYRNSKTVPFDWIRKISFNEVILLQLTLMDQLTFRYTSNCRPYIFRRVAEKPLIFGDTD